MSLTCMIFGHKTNPHKYGKIIGLYNPWYDAIGRSHHDIKFECVRCGEAFTVCKVHGYHQKEMENCKDN